MLTYSSHAHALSKPIAKILIMYRCLATHTHAHIGSYWFNTTELHATKP